MIWKRALDMEKDGNRAVESQSEPIHLDLNRKHTEAEVELVSYCFDCSIEEARRILSVRVTRERLAEVHGMLDAMRIERMEAEGYVIPVPSCKDSK